MSCQAVTARRDADVAEGRGKRCDRDPSDERVEGEHEPERSAEEGQGQGHAGEMTKVEGQVPRGERGGEALYAAATYSVSCRQ